MPRPPVVVVATPVAARAWAGVIVPLREAAARAVPGYQLPL